MNTENRVYTSNRKQWQVKHSIFSAMATVNPMVKKEPERVILRFLQRTRIHHSIHSTRHPWSWKNRQTTRPNCPPSGTSLTSYWKTHKSFRTNRLSSVQIPSTASNASPHGVIIGSKMAGKHHPNSLWRTKNWSKILFAWKTYSVILIIFVSSISEAINRNHSTETHWNGSCGMGTTKWMLTSISCCYCRQHNFNIYLFLR